MKNVFGDFSFGFDDVLEGIGLARKRSAFEKIAPALAIFGVGILVGAGVGMLTAPREGRMLREDLGRRVDKLRGQIKGQLKEGVMNARTPNALENHVARS